MWYLGHETELRTSKIQRIFRPQFIIKNKKNLCFDKNGKEAKFIVKAKEGNISIDGTVRTAHKYPVDIMDRDTINQTSSN